MTGLSRGIPKGYMTIIFKNNLYTVHIEMVSGGFQGYIVSRGEFVCTLPVKETRDQLLDEAERRLNELE